ncbi:uncharacterized protein LOC119384307 [Rhipicephalus sanguineus]|uniref:uncharacterized protein LOC119384307 n=1 Tax=Rhipicephalus sanguineus TaxID=34632 RepID=UPI001893E655|nr:uncharacterized protein LOC119384307 [Rhipicephalus sanguineus]
MPPLLFYGTHYRCVLDSTTASHIRRRRLLSSSSGCQRQGFLQRADGHRLEDTAAGIFRYTFVRGKHAGDPVPPRFVRFRRQVAPETFTARTAALGAYSSGPSVWDTHTQQPGKVRYSAVCKLDKIRTPDHPECLMASRAAEDDNLLVATFSDEAALLQRMSQSYDDGMGVAPVAVYNVDLDDYLGNCSGTAIMSPLVRALASGISDSATKIFN